MSPRTTLEPGFTGPPGGQCVRLWPLVTTKAQTIHQRGASSGIVPARTDRHCSAMSGKRGCILKRRKKGYAARRHERGGRGRLSSIRFAEARRRRSGCRGVHGQSNKAEAGTRPGGRRSTNLATWSDDHEVVDKKDVRPAAEVPMRWGLGADRVPDHPSRESSREI